MGAGMAMTGLAIGPRTSPTIPTMASRLRFTLRTLHMAPVRPMKTMVRAFLVDAECHQVGAILVNDVTACMPGNANACLDQLDLSTRVKNVRLYK
jgi:hypothetical protein